MPASHVILGVSNTKDAGAAIVVDGRVVAAINEERLTREKLVQQFPVESIRYVLREANLGIEDVDVVTSGAWRGFDESEVLLAYLEDVAWHVQQDPARWNLIRQRASVTLERDGMFRRELLDGLQELGLLSRLQFVDHHRAHAAGAYYCSPFDEALVAVMDARGDFKSCSAYTANSSGLTLQNVVTDLNSPGLVYSFVTRILGFTPDRHEGKVTGLAAHGDPEKTRHIFDRMVSFDEDGNIRANLGDHFSPFLSAQLPVIERELSGHRREDVAAGVQNWLEEIAVAYVGRQLKDHPSRFLCLAGGVFANVRVNQELRERLPVENVYIHQHMGDGGIALGSALSYWHEQCNGERTTLHDVYLGPAFSEAEVSSALEEVAESVTVLRLSEAPEAAARLLAAGHVVGWFQGRMEYGPRALCNRSILVQATDHGINDTLNSRLTRTEFMPFAPVTLNDDAPKNYLGWNEDHIASRFMTTCYDCTPEFREQCPAVVHVDGTARPQVVRREDNPEMYQLLLEYRKLTGLSSVVNTSFNNHEEPIVCTPGDAIASLLRDNVDVLIMGNLLAVRSDDPHGVLSRFNEDALARC